MATKKKNTTKKQKSGSLSSGKGWFKAFLVATILLLSIKTFLVEPFIVKSTNMGSTVLSGEVVLVSKLNYGARLPITLLSVPFFGYSHYLDWIELPVKRVPGTDSLERFELVLFNAPYEQEKPIDKRDLLLSRVVGLPGEEFELINYRCNINDRLIDIPNQNICNKYTVQVESESVFQQMIVKYGLIEGSVTKSNTYIITCSPDIANNMMNEAGIKKITLIDNYQDDQELIYGSNQNKKWNKKNFGPIHIPAKGDKVMLNSRNAEIYLDIIKNHENNEVLVSGSEIKINGVKSDSYIFKDDYYFVLDDNRSDSKDSRYWGFLPKTHIIGKSTFVLFPASKIGMRENIKRVLKKTI